MGQKFPPQGKRSYEGSCRETLVYIKMEKDRIASFRDHRAEPQKKLLRNTFLPDHLFAENHHIRSNTPGADAQGVFKKNNKKLAECTSPNSENS